MLTKRSLRILIIAEFVLAIVAPLVSLYTESLLPEPLRAYEEAQSEAEITIKDWLLLIIGVPLVIAAIVSMIGLFFFWRPARRLYLWTGIAGLPLLPFFGPYLDLGWGQMLGEAASILWGVILACVFWTPLKVLYEKPRDV